MSGANIHDMFIDAKRGAAINEGYNLFLAGISCLNIFQNKVKSILIGQRSQFGMVTSKENAVSASGFEMGSISLNMERDYNNVFVKKCGFHFPNDYGEMEVKFFKAGKDGIKNRLVIEWTEPRDDPFGTIRRRKVEVFQRFCTGAKLEGNKLTVRTYKEEVEIRSGFQFWNDEKRTLDKTGWGIANRDMDMAERMHDDLQDEPGQNVDVVVHITSTNAKAQRIFAPLLLAIGEGDLAGGASAPQTAALPGQPVGTSTAAELAENVEAPTSTSSNSEKLLEHAGVEVVGSSPKRAAETPATHKKRHGHAGEDDGARLAKRQRASSPDGPDGLAHAGFGVVGSSTERAAETPATHSKHHGNAGEDDDARLANQQSMMACMSLMTATATAYLFDLI